MRKVCILVILIGLSVNIIFAQSNKPAPVPGHNSFGKNKTVVTQEMVKKEVKVLVGLIEKKISLTPGMSSNLVITSERRLHDPNNKVKNDALDLLGFKGGGSTLFVPDPGKLDIRFADVGANGWGEPCPKKVSCDGIIFNNSSVGHNFMEEDKEMQQIYLNQYFNAIKYWQSILQNLK